MYYSGYDFSYCEKNNLNLLKLVKQLDSYIELIKEFNDSKNLISKNDLEIIKSRHINDCLNLNAYINQHQTFLDIGTGAGLPGIVLAITNPSKYFNLLDSNSNKISFLKFVQKELDILNINLINDRIEQVNDFKVDALIFRAFSSIDKILNLITKIFDRNTTVYCMKGINYKAELPKQMNEYIVQAKRLDLEGNSNLIIINRK